MNPIADALDVQSWADIVAARKLGRELAVRLGFGAADQARLATAISELTRNVVQYAGRGRCTIRDASDPRARRVRVEVEDWGPGIEDIEQALQDGYSTRGGLGAGLPGTRRLMSEFAVESRPGLTRVMIALARPRRL